VQADLITCADLDRLVPRYLNSDLGDGQVAALYAHVAQCDECRSHLERYRTVVMLLKDERYKL
jgi:hypothetical protein